MRILSRKHQTTIVTALVGAVVGPAPVASAETFSVTNLMDAGAGSLREAITSANSSAGADTIVFSGIAPNQLLPLTTALPDVTGPLVIDATGAPGLTIQGFDPSSALLSSATDLTLRSVQFENGQIDLGFSNAALDESASSAIDGSFSGTPAELVKIGPGTVSLNGVSNLTNLVLTTAGRIDEGTLEVNGLIVLDSFTVGPAGTLSGAQGTGVAAVAAQQPVTVLGRVAPSTTSGVLTLYGGARFESGSALEIDVLPGGTGDELVVSTGSVTIASGAQLRLLAQPSAFTAASSIRVLTAPEGISGSFAVTDFAFLDETVTQGPTQIDVMLAPNGLTFSSFASTDNQRSVAQALESSAPSATGDLANVFAALDSSTSDDVPGLLDAIGSETLTTFATARQILGERTARSVQRRVRDAAWGEGEALWARGGETSLPVLAAGFGAMPLGFRTQPPRATKPPKPAMEPLGTQGSPPGGGVWLDGFALYGTLEGGGHGAADLDTLLFGGTLGADVWLAERFVVGLAAGYARGDVDIDDRSADASLDTVQGTLYAGYAHPRGFASVYGRYAYSFLDSERDIVSSTLARTADADWNAQDYGAGAEGGVTLFRAGPVAFQPLAGVDWLRLTEEDYRESGAGSLSLDVDPEDLDSVTTRLGGRLLARLRIDEHSELVPELRAYWQRELGDRDRVLDAQLIGASSGGAIRVRGAELPRDAAILGLGWSASVSSALQVLADYDAVLGSKRVEHQGTLAIRVRF